MALNLEIKERISHTLKGRPEIRFALLYGSAAEGQPFRDLDIGICVDRVLVPTTQDLDYAFVIATDLEKTMSRRTDVRVINDAPLPFRYNVSCGIPLIINDRQAHFSFLERTWDDFLDFRPVAMAYLKDLA